MCKHKIYTYLMACETHVVVCVTMYYAYYVTKNRRECIAYRLRVLMKHFSLFRNDMRGN